MKKLMLLFLMIGCDEARIVQNTDSEPIDNEEQTYTTYCKVTGEDFTIDVRYSFFVDYDGNKIESIGCDYRGEENYRINGGGSDCEFGDDQVLFVENDEIIYQDENQNTYDCEVYEVIP